MDVRRCVSGITAMLHLQAGLRPRINTGSRYVHTPTTPRSFLSNAQPEFLAGYTVAGQSRAYQRITDCTGLGCWIYSTLVQHDVPASAAP